MTDAPQQTPRPKPAEILLLLRSRWPIVFDVQRPRPLAIGAGDELLARAEELSVSRSAIRDFLRWWTNSDRYLRMLATPDMRRHTLEGTDAGPVLDEHRRIAAVQLKERQKRRQSSPRPPRRPRGPQQPAPPESE
jgi:sRNA-binding protein